jgi:hypothetical protein
LVVTKLDRLARSLPDARTIADELTAGQTSHGLRCQAAACWVCWLAAAASS